MNLYHKDDERLYRDSNRSVQLMTVKTWALIILVLLAFVLFSCGLYIAPIYIIVAVLLRIFT